MQKSNLQVGREIILLAKRLPEEINAARREGLPLEAKDLVRHPAVSASANAASFYRQIQRLPSDGKNGEDTSAIIKSLREAANPTNLTTLMLAKQHLQTKSAALRLVSQAVARPHCDFTRKWEQGFNLPMPELAGMREVARLLQSKPISCWQKIVG